VALIVGVTGMPGAGKTTAARHLSGLGYTVLSMGDVIREEVARQLRGIKSVQTRQEPGAPVAAVDSIPDAVGRAVELFLGDGRQEAAQGAGEEGAGLFLRLGADEDG